MTNEKRLPNLAGVSFEVKGCRKSSLDQHCSSSLPKVPVYLKGALIQNPSFTHDYKA
ncbi:MAG TPA: hypothetical protein PLU80_11425 [Acidobacteriota bacterium]|nr:hypothetical protein [Acidobacteriota bacterium]